MKKWLAIMTLAILLFASSLTGCSIREDRFLPVAMLIERSDAGLLVTLAGLVPTGSEDDPDEFEARGFECDSISDAFSSGAFEPDMLDIIIIDRELALGGLYSLYSPVFYDGSASEGARLALARDPSSLLEGDEPLFELADGDISAPSVLKFDVAARTPGAVCAVPIVARGDDGLAVESAALFIGGEPVCEIKRDALGLLALFLNGRASATLDAPSLDGDRATVELTLTMSVDASLTDEGGISYEIAISGEGLVAGRESGHEDVMKDGDSELLAASLERSVTSMCREFIDETVRECGREVFGFSRHALAIERADLEDIIAEFPVDRISFDVTSCDIVIRNLSQIH